VGSATLTGADILLGGNNGIGNPTTKLIIGSGGLTMTGRTITLNQGNAGTELILNGDFIGTGTNQIATGTGGTINPRVAIGAASRNFAVNSGTTTVAMEIQGIGGSLVKSGNGTLNLTGPNTYTGTTAVTTGSLLVNGTHTGGAAYTVATGATLGGHGSTASSVASNGGTLAPGVTLGATGNLATGALSLDAVSSFAVDFNGASADGLTVTGTVALGGNLSRNVIAAPTADIITLIDNDGTTDLTTGTFNGIADGDTLTIGTAEYRLFYNGGDGNDVILVSTAPPSTIYIDDDFTGSQGFFIDGDLEAGGNQFAIYDVSAFNSVADALAKYANYSGTLVVNGGSYASAIDLTSASNGAGAIDLQFVNDLTNGESAVAVTAFLGDAADSLNTSLHNSTGIDLTTSGGAFHGGISGLGGITLDDGGAGNSLSLSAANTYSGATTVVSGSLAVTNTTGSATGSGNVTVQSGSSLIGTGSIDGGVTVHAGASVEPGIADIASIGTGDLALGTGSTLVIQLSDAPANDRVNVSGTVNLTGADLDLVQFGTAPTTGTFTIIDNDDADAVTGTFDGLAEGSLVAVNVGTDLAPVAGTIFRISYQGGDGNDVVLTALTQATTGISIDGNGDLVIDDVLGTEDTPDRLFVGIVDGVLVIRDPKNVLGSTVNGAQQSGLYEVRVGLDDFTGDIVIRSGGGDDVITLGDLTGLPGGILIDGGEGFDYINIGSSAGATITAASGADLSFSAERIRAYGSSLTVSGDGNIVMTSAGSGPGLFDGINLTQSTLSSEEGDIDLLGQGGSRAGYNTGISLYGSSATSQTGDISLTGLGGGAGLINHGISLVNGSSLATGGAGAITLIGTGATGTGSNSGIFFNNGSSASVEDGDLSLTGRGGGSGHQSKGVLSVGSSFSSSGSGDIVIEGFGSGTGSNGYGVQLSNNTLVNASGTGSIDVDGTASASGNSYGRGVFLYADTILRTAGGGIAIDGTGGGTGSSNEGVNLMASVTVEVTAGAGTLAIAGTGSTTGNSNNSGVILNSAITVQSVDGLLTISGTGNGSGRANGGIAAIGAAIRTSGAGDVTLIGVASTTATGQNNSGISLTGRSSVQGLGTGGVTLTGTGGTAGSHYNEGIKTAAGIQITTLSGDIILSGTAGGTASYNRGILISGTTLNSGAGNLSVTGTGTQNPAATGNQNQGIYAVGSTLTSGGTMGLTGIGGRGTSNNHGIQIHSSALNASGLLTLLGTANSLTTGKLNTGVYVSNLSSLNGAGGSSLTGIGGGGTSANHGIFLTKDISSNLPLGSFSGTAGPGTGSSDKTGGFAF
jgi:hypothetical protein